MLLALAWNLIRSSEVLRSELKDSFHVADFWRYTVPVVAVLCEIT